MPELREIIKKKDDRIEKLEQSMDVLTYKLDEYEQYSRRNALPRISGIPGEGEEEEDVMDEMMFLINTRLELSPPITLDQIYCTHHHVGKLHGPSVSNLPQIRDQVFRNRKKLNTRNQRSAFKADARSGKNDENDLDNGNAYDNENKGISGQLMPIQLTFDQTAMNNAKTVVNEDLTKLRASLFWKLKNLIRKKVSTPEAVGHRPAGCLPSTIMEMLNK